jgi:hypothetical protein
MKNVLVLAFSLVAIAGCINARDPLGIHHEPKVSKETGRPQKPDDATVEVFYAEPTRAYDVLGLVEESGSEGKVLHELERRVRSMGGDGVIVTGSGNQTILGGMVRRTMSGKVFVWKSAANVPPAPAP